MGKKLDSSFRFLEANEFFLWDDFVEASPQGSVFCYSWWLKAVGGEVRVLGYFDKGRLVGGIPLYFKKKFGFTICTMPKLTQTWGVVIEPLSGKRVTAASKEMKILRKFADAVAKNAIFMQSMSPNLQNWLPFYWNGLKQTSMFTYVIDDLTDLAKVWKGFRENIQTDIRKAKSKGITVKPCSLEIALQTFKKTYERQGTNLPYSNDYLSRIYYEAKKHNAGEMFAAIDIDEKTHAAAFLVWDKKRAYYLVGGGDPALRNSGATSLLIWNMIQFVAEKTLVFDFEGSVVEPIERFFRAFGGRQTMYNAIYKFPWYLRIIQAVRGK